VPASPAPAYMGARAAGSAALLRENQNLEKDNKILANQLANKEMALDISQKLVLKLQSDIVTLEAVYRADLEAADLAAQQNLQAAHDWHGTQMAEDTAMHEAEIHDMDHRLFAAEEELAATVALM
jgi:hypothetical protein